VKEAIGVDASPRAVELAERRRRERGFANVRFVRADVADLTGVAEASVDLAGAFDLLEHIDDETVRRMLRALSRALKPGGVFVAYTPNREHYVERLKAHNLLLDQFPEHIAVRRPREIRQLLESEGWRIRSLRYSTAPFPGVRWIERALAPFPLMGTLFRYRILVEAALD
jgi:SAM-dependent methyltransferase